MGKGLHVFVRVMYDHAHLCKVLRIDRTLHLSNDFKNCIKNVQFLLN